ncbi:MAG: DUF1549 domain-containing protein [Pirellulales bacterium]
MRNIMAGIGTLGLSLLLCAGLLANIGRCDERPLRDQIDAAISNAWQQQQVVPAPPSADGEFLRRVYLDLLGSVPTYDETVAFLANETADKRSRLVDLLLEDPRYAQHQADIWDQTLFGRHPPGYGTDQRGGIQAWLRQQFAENIAYNTWVRALLRAEGNSVEQGPPVYWMQYSRQPEDASESVSQIFLGVQLQCARCHDHPFENWTQTDFYGLAAFLSRLEVVQVGTKDNLAMFAIGEKSSGDILFTGPAKDQQPGQQGEPVKPKFLLGDPLAEPPLPDDFKETRFEANKPPPAPLFSRRDQLADWITQPDNPYFARAIANRLWAQYLGRGLIHPVDNMSPSRLASHPELLTTLTTSLVEHSFDLKWFVRELVNSQTYQLSSAGSTGEAQPLWFQHARTRPLSAEELVEAWRVVSGYNQAESLAGKPPATNRFQPLTGGYVLQFFGEPVTGAGDIQIGLAEHLYQNNGELGQFLVERPGTLLAELASPDATWESRVDRLYFQILNRPAQADERQQLVELLSSGATPAEALRNVVWAMLTCGEFRFNH